MTDETVTLLKLHPCSKGLSDEAIEGIAEAAELVHCEPGQVIHRAGEIVTSVFFVVHGRLKLTLTDINGNEVAQRFHTSGCQFGGFSAALAEPVSVDCVAVDPSTLLRFDYETVLELTRKHGAFRANCTRLMAESIRQVIFNDKRPVRPLLMAFFHQSDETRIVSQRLFQRLSEMGETPHILTDRPVNVDGIDRVRVVDGDQQIRPDEVRSLVTRWAESGRVFVAVDTAMDPTRASNALEKSERVFWCVTPQNWQASLDRLRPLLFRAPAWRDKVCVVWLLEPEEEAPVADDLRELASRDIKVSLGKSAPNQGPALFAGMERLVHLVRGVQIGVALGGGAARGMAHLGVLKALEQSGITVDMIAGTSAGAMTGTLYSSGMDVDYSVDCFVNDLRPSWFFRCLPRGDQWYLLYKYRRGQFDPMLRKHLKDKRLEQLPVPMHTITVDLISGKAVVRDAGDAVHGILESINLPVLSHPINRQGEALVDGGLIDNVPADVLVSKGCNFVIAVSVTAKMELEFAKNSPQTPASQMRRASTIQTLLRSYLVQSHNLNSHGVRAADVVIEPDVTGFELSEFTRTDELAAIGEQATLEAVPKIRKLLHRLDGELFPL